MVRLVCIGLAATFAATSGGPLNIFFVCKQNTCRSFMADIITRTLFECLDFGEEGVTIDSFGVKLGEHQKWIKEANENAIKAAYKLADDPVKFKELLAKVTGVSDPPTNRGGIALCCNKLRENAKNFLVDEMPSKQYEPHTVILAMTNDFVEEVKAGVAYKMTPENMKPDVQSLGISDKVWLVSTIIQSCILRALLKSFPHHWSNFDGPFASEIMDLSQIKIYVSKQEYDDLKIVDHEEKLKNLEPEDIGYKFDELELEENRESKDWARNELEVGYEGYESVIDNKTQKEVYEKNVFAFHRLFDIPKLLEYLLENEMGTIHEEVKSYWQHVEDVYDNLLIDMMDIGYNLLVKTKE